jgi:predicted nucleic acid-binding protein
MRLIDSSAWIEWLTGSEAGKSVAEVLPPQSEWVVPTVVQLELMKWLTCEMDEGKADEVIAFTQLCIIVPLDTRIALMAAEYCRAHKLSTADAIIYATAQDRSAELVTCDAHFQVLEGVRYIMKG